MKTCTKCQAEKDEGEFPLAPLVRIRKDGSRPRRAICNGCRVEEQRLYAALKTPARLRAKRHGHLRQKYNISVDDFDALLAAQGGRCANQGCRTDVPGGKGSFHVDHDHKTGRLRRLLCSSCNQSLGGLGDGYANERILGLYEYAVEHSSNRVFEAGVSGGLL